MDISLSKIETLLEEFSKLPKNNIETTYLEICKYPKNRFEEICSRILKFYLEPNGEHGFKDLFISSLFELIGKRDHVFDISDIEIISEENAERKRIDLLIKSSEFVIGIENKITASLYNPLSIYKKRMKQYNNKNAYGIILSLYKIRDPEEISLINKYDYIQILYRDYFNKIKLNMVNYNIKTNSRYKVYLDDFMQTLENMEDNMHLNKKLSNYFFDKEAEIEELKEKYEEYKKIIDNTHLERIEKLVEILKKETKDNKWQAVAKDGTLSYGNEKFMIDSSYVNTRENICGKFEIQFFSPKLSDWSKYENVILNDFPEKKLEKEDGGARLHLENIENNDEDKTIIKKLIYYYNYYKKLMKK